MSHQDLLRSRNRNSLMSDCGFQLAATSLELGQLIMAVALYRGIVRQDQGERGRPSMPSRQLGFAAGLDSIDHDRVARDDQMIMCESGEPFGSQCDHAECCEQEWQRCDGGLSNAFLHGPRRASLCPSWHVLLDQDAQCVCALTLIDDRREIFSLQPRLACDQKWFAAELGEPPSQGLAFADAVERYGDLPLVAIPDASLPVNKLQQYIGPSRALRVRALQPLEVSPLMESAVDVRIFQLIEQTFPEPMPLEEIRDGVEGAFQREAADRALRESLARFWRDADVALAPEAAEGIEAIRRAE